eukprot:TRINITY_DN64272_c0_g1_i1.p1 TRINITY_DN64272_c0_g1~~TRINITY_DN64272_c0_g1_i1.p1  ORF type:complete len:299 (-),score=44.79 TRINITY_DN64272_c0_g1_i1:123-959(-)
MAAVAAAAAALHVAIGSELNFAALAPSPLRSERGVGRLRGASSSSARDGISAGGASTGGFLGGCALALGVAAARFGAKGRRRQEGLRAVTEIGEVKLILVGGKATPAPPVGPAVGSFGLNIPMFCKEFNALTSDKVGETCVVVLHVMSDKSFTIEMKTPPTAALLHKAVGKTKGSGKAGTDIIGTITIDKLREIAEIKLPDLNVQDITRAMKIVHGTAVASGVNVEGYDEWLRLAVPKPKSIMDRYGPSLDNLPAPWGNGPPLENSQEEAAEPESVAA